MALSSLPPLGGQPVPARAVFLRHTAGSMGRAVTLQEKGGDSIEDGS